MPFRKGGKGVVRNTKPKRDRSLTRKSAAVCPVSPGLPSQLHTVASMALHAEIPQPHSWPQQLSLTTKEESHLLLQSFSDFKARTSCSAVSVACLGWSLVLSLDYICMSLGLLLNWGPEKSLRPFSLTNCKISWVRSCLKGTTSFILIYFAPELLFYFYFIFEHRTWL